MQKIRQYILKGKEVYVGLEDAKKTWKICVRSGRTVVHETTMPAKYEVLRNYFKNKFPECRIRVMYEAGFRGFELHDKLVGDGCQCIVTPPHTVTQEKCSKTKNDRIDCRRMSKNNENGDYRSCFVPDRQHRHDRQVTRLSSQLQRDITRVCNQIRRAMEFNGLEEYFPAGSWSPSQYKQAEETMKTVEISDSLRFVFAMLFEKLRQARTMRSMVLRRMRALGRSERYRKAVELLQSAPGIGPLTAIRLALEWGDVSRFKRKEEFSSFTGLIPSDYSTGEQDHKGHITRQGNRQVRGWLIECAWIAIRHDPVLLEKYRRVLSHCGSSKKAIVAVARKIAIRLRAILIQGTPYKIGIMDTLAA